MAFFRVKVFPAVYKCVFATIWIQSWYFPKTNPSVQCSSELIHADVKFTSLFIFVHILHQLYRSGIRLKLLFRMKNLLRKSTLKSMTDHYQCNLKLILEKLHKLIKMSNKWKKCVVFLVRLLLLLPSRSPSKILYARFEQCVFLRIYSPMAINNLIVILLWFINTGDVKCPADLL